MQAKASPMLKRARSQEDRRIPASRSPQAMMRAACWLLQNRRWIAIVTYVHHQNCALHAGALLDCAAGAALHWLCPACCLLLSEALHCTSHTGALPDRAAGGRPHGRAPQADACAAADERRHDDVRRRIRGAAARAVAPGAQFLLLLGVPAADGLCLPRARTRAWQVSFWGETSLSKLTF